VTGRSLATRRQLLSGAGALVVGGALLGPAADALGQSQDIASMEDAVRLEQALAVAYASLATRPGIDRGLRDMFGLLASHEHQHAAALLSLLEYIGGPPPPVPTLAATEQALPGLAEATDRRSALVFAERLENAEVFAFYQGEQMLDDVKLMELALAVMCSDAQHLALVRQAAGENPIPSAFESGRQSG
jgi:Ferritin-like domain